MPDFGLFGLEFENTIVVIEIKALKFFSLPNFVQEQNCLNLGPKMPYFGIVIFEIITLEFFSKRKVLSKNENGYI